MKSEAFENGRKRAMEKLGFGQESGLPPQKGAIMNSARPVKITNDAKKVPGTFSRKPIFLNSKQQGIRQEALDVQARQAEARRRVFGSNG